MTLRHLLLREAEIQVEGLARLVAWLLCGLARVADDAQALLVWTSAGPPGLPSGPGCALRGAGYRLRMRAGVVSERWRRRRVDEIMAPVYADIARLPAGDGESRAPEPRAPGRSPASSTREPA